MNGAIRIADPAQLGPALAQIRNLLGLSRSDLGRLIEAATGPGDARRDQADPAVGQREALAERGVTRAGARSPRLRPGAGAREDA